MITKDMMEMKFDELVISRTCKVNPKGAGADKSREKSFDLNIVYTGATLGQVLEQASARIAITVQNGTFRPKFDTFPDGTSFTYRLIDAGKREPLTEEKKIDNGLAALEARAKANGTTVMEEFQKELEKRNQ